MYRRVILPLSMSQGRTLLNKTSCPNLSNFIDTCKDLLTTYCTDSIRQAEGNLWILFSAAICQLEGRAEVVAFNNNCTNILE